MDFFPFHAIGFRCNPFRTLTAEECAALAVMGEEIQAAAQGGFTHLQILGELGHGKTTHLLALQAQLRAQGRHTAYEYLAEGQSNFLTNLAGLEVFFLDEAQRLNRSNGLRLLNCAALSAGAPGLRLVLGSHVDLRSLFIRHGLPLQSVRIRNRPEHLGQVLARRLAYFALPTGPAPTGEPPVSIETPAVELLYRSFDGNYRAILDFLYEFFQRFPTPGVLTAAQVRAVIDALGAPG